MPAPLVRPRRKDAIATRARLVRAAIDLFTAEGYRGTTTLDLAARAGIAEATIYRHFTGKDALFNEALRHALRFGAQAAREAARDPGVPCRERLRRIGNGLVQRAAQDPALVLLLLRRPAGAPPLDDASQMLAREFRDGLAQVVAGGKQEGAIRAGSVELWGAVWLALVAFAVDRVAGREWSAAHPGVAQTLDAAWDAIAYRAPGDAPA